MEKLPHEVERLGPELRSWVEQQLLEDLRHYGIHQDDLRFDWSQVVQEGHWTDYRSRMLESLSDISLRDADGGLMAEGWMDFVRTDRDSELTVFWLFLSVVADGDRKEVKSDAFLPSHLWDTLTDAQRQFVATTESEWLHRDPKVQEWKQRNQLTSGSTGGPKKPAAGKP
jgi:hypothetical protein